MKKNIIILLIAVSIAVSAIYFLIPSTQTLSVARLSKCTETGASRFILNPKKWQAWWPGKITANNFYSYKNYIYRIDKIFFNSVKATIFSGTDSLKGTFSLIASKDSSIGFLWASPIVFSSNPVTRLLEYNRYGNFKTNIDNLFDDMKIFFDKEENIYGIKIAREKIPASSMISLKQIFSTYPTTSNQYQMIDLVNEYIERNGGEKIAAPMLNVHQEDAAHFEAMIAIPTNKDLPSAGNFSLKRFPGGYMLKASVTGGIFKIANAEKEMENYILDYQKSSPAIPYQSLVTNRLLVADSSKWITEIFYPVFF